MKVRLVCVKVPKPLRGVVRLVMKKHLKTA